MALSILNNIASLEAQNQLATTNMKLQNVLFQLSSGSKINSGADDPAGLSIADGLQANISALAQSAQNVSDGVGMLQTADGALSQVTTLLNRAVTLATQAANSGLTQGVGGQQAALQNEFQSITNEVNQIGSNTTYNNNAVFTGGNMSVFLSDGSAADSADPNIYVAMPNLSAASLGLSSYVTGTLDLTNNPTAGNTVKIGSQTYKFVAAGQANAAGDVALGNGVQSTLQNLQAAVNGSPGAGNTYGAGTTPNTLATIISANGGSAVVQALNAGSTGNSVELSTNLTSTVGAAGGGTALSGGVNATSSTGTLTLNAQPGVISTATATLTMTAVPGTCEEIEFGPVFNPVKY
jgi:flagellin